MTLYSSWKSLCSDVVVVGWQIKDDIIWVGVVRSKDEVYGLQLDTNLIPLVS